VSGYQSLHSPVIDRVLFSEEEIAEAVKRLGAQVTAEYAGKDLALVTVLRGGIIFLADLCRHVQLPVTLDFMAVSSYGGAGRAVRITKDLDDAVEGRHVLVVEDIIDTGLTLNYILSVIRGRNPASVAVCTLLDKEVRRLVELPIAFRGMRIPDRFVVGYGLDIGGRYRNLPCIATLHDEVMG
jgi:hypoxanthine phosphoribosyltransferase